MPADRAQTAQTPEIAALPLRRFGWHDITSLASAGMVFGSFPPRTIKLDVQLVITL